MVSDRWLTIFDRAMRKPRPTTGLPHGVVLTKRYVLQAWVDLVNDQLHLPPQDTHEQRTNAAEESWWKFLFPDEPFPRRHREFQKIAFANKAYFRSLPADTSQWHYIVRKAVREGHRVASLCESWIEVRTQLAEDQYYFSRQNTPIFRYKAELMWFGQLFPGEVFPGQPPQSWLDSDNAISAAKQQQTDETKRLGAVKVQGWLGVVPARGNRVANQALAPNTRQNNLHFPLSTIISAQSSLTLQPHSLSGAHAPWPEPRVSHDAVPQGHRSRIEQNQQTSYYPLNIPYFPNPRPTLPWEVQGISIDGWTTEFLDSALEEHRRSICEPSVQRSTVEDTASASNKRSRDDSGEDRNQKRARLEWIGKQKWGA
ncbi:hypothetical protein BKA65DRAFT_559507 [Rhexocercosporidium sp. MPI-PUGE-AT-0058]|nr:hypothetical protein BKA65DRAFT_559507 [Rhexocercosporidium sp. MPI-PUGE-AT-0058]